MNKHQRDFLFTLLTMYGTGGFRWDNFILLRRSMGLESEHSLFFGELVRAGWIRDAGVHSYITDKAIQELQHEQPTT
jgi:hypothetical protein